MTTDISLQSLASMNKDRHWMFVSGTAKGAPAIATITESHYCAIKFRDGSTLGLLKVGGAYYCGYASYERVAQVGRLLTELPSALRAAQARECGTALGEDLIRIGETIWRVVGDQCDFVSFA
jgi:hypothetical protein